MNFNTPSTTIFNPEIISCLSANGFTRIDNCADKNIMYWHKESTLIEFSGNELFIKALVPDEKPFCAYYMKGFSPYNSVLFAFLMHNWGIILLDECAQIIKDTELAASGLKTNFN